MSAERALAVITGASSGIGKAIAERLAARGYDLVLVARREETITQLAESLRAAHGVACVPYRADVARREEREEIVRQLADDAGRIEVLVNNAGFGTHGFFRETDLDRELELIEVNCAAPVHLAKRILPWMLARKKGYIMNVGSVAAFTPGPVMALYYASKAFVLSFSEALWEECQGTGVTVTALCPGPVKTEFQRVAGLAPGARTSGAPAMMADVVAAEGVDAMFSGKRVVIPGRANRWLALAARYLPRSRTLKRVRMIQEERRRQTRMVKGL